MLQIYTNQRNYLYMSSISRRIEIPACLTKPEAIKYYRDDMRKFYEEMDSFYSSPGDKPIGRFCES